MTRLLPCDQAGAHTARNLMDKQPVDDFGEDIQSLSITLTQTWEQFQFFLNTVGLTHEEFGWMVSSRQHQLDTLVLKHDLPDGTQVHLKDPNTGEVMLVTQVGENEGSFTETIAVPVTFFPLEDGDLGLRWIFNSRESRAVTATSDDPEERAQALRQMREFGERNRQLGLKWPVEPLRPLTLPAIIPTAVEITRHEMPSNQIAKLVQDGLISGYGWSENPTRLRMEFRTKASRSAPSPFDACLVIGREDTPPAEVFSDPGTLALWLQPLREITDRFDPLCSDVHDILAMHWLEHRDADGWAILNIADMMKYREKDTGGKHMREDDIRRYSEALRAVLRPAIEGQGPAYRKSPKRKSSKPETIRYTGPIWHSEIIEIPAMFGPGLIEAVKYQPGTWLLSTIEPYAQMLLKRTPILIRLNAKQELHKKIGKALDYYYKVNRGAVRITIRALLEGARIKVPDWAKTGDAGKFIGRVEKALSELYDLEALGEYTPQNILKTLPARGKLEAWLKTIYTFEPMTETNEQYQRIQKVRVKAIEHSKQAAAVARKKTSKERNSDTG